jgi:hypothetical protein
LGLRAEISVFLEGQSKSSKELRGALPGRGRVAEAEGERPAVEFCGGPGVAHEQRPRSDDLCREVVKATTLPEAVPAILRSVPSTARRSRYMVTDSQRKNAAGAAVCRL